MDRYHYADRTFLKALNLNLVDPPGESEFAPLRVLLQRMADVIGGDVRELVPPEKFIREPAEPRAGGQKKPPMSAKQRALLNEHLTPRYAERNVAEQQQLLAQVVVNEDREPVVPLAAYFRDHRVQHVTFSTRPIHEACGEGWAGKERVFVLRRTVAEKIARLFRALNTVGLVGHVEDAWRHRNVQQGLLIRRIIQMARDYEEHGWDWQRVKTASMSFTAAVPKLAGHMAASALDFRICQFQEGAAEHPCLDIGNEYPDGGAVSSLDFPYLTFKQWCNREIFAQGAAMGGLKVLWTEDWHVSDGDPSLSLSRIVQMLTARNGPIRSFDEHTGEVQPYTHGEMTEFLLADAEIEDLVDWAREKSGNAYHHSVVELADMVRRARAGVSSEE